MEFRLSIFLMAFLVSTPAASAVLKHVIQDAMEDTLMPPRFVNEHPGYEPCGNDIAFLFENPNKGASTEIWRSRSPDSGFELIDVGSPGGGYLDEDLGSRKTYYYKLRAVTPTDTSDFSETRPFESGAEWFDPLLELTLLEDNTVAGKLIDRSYLDASYDIWHGSSPDGFYTQANMADSGRVFTFTDRTVHAGHTYTYQVDAYLVMSCGGISYFNVASATIVIPNDNAAETLTPPSFINEHPGYEPCGNDLAFAFENPNEGSNTEIWRSRSLDSGFELIDVVSQDGGYLDEDLASRKAYYYKLRAVTATTSSEFSETESFESGAEWFDPVLELTLLPDNTVQGKLTDRSYLDARYEISWGTSPDGFFTSTNMTDSGSVFTFTDASVQPGQTYTYQVNANLVMTCGGISYSNVATATVTIPDDNSAEDLTPPQFTDEHPGYEPCGNHLAFAFDNPNEGTNTEIWRSRSPNSGFELIDVVSEDGGYLDEDLGSRKTYYYKLRAVTATTTSEFSETESFESGAAWVDPVLELTLLPDNTVQGKLTDRSYLDASYEISWGTSPDGFFTNTNMTDSGSVFTFTDSSVQSGQTYTYQVNAILSMTCGGISYSNVASATITIPDENSAEDLSPPQFINEHPGYEPCGNHLAFAFDNPNEGANTEIWRSRSPNSGFELIDVVSEDGGYLDEDLGSRKAYYYKLRAVTATTTSEFSETESFESGAEWFDPVLELTLLPDNTVQGKLTDRSYLDASYEISWGTSPDGFFTSTNMTDSGSVFTFTDTSVQPEQTYTYQVNAILSMTCGGISYSNVASATITIPDENSAEDLSPPQFINEHPGYEPCGNHLAFAFDNPNEGANTEIWRSRSPDSGFELIDVVSEDGGYLDEDLGSRKAYYYKLRAVTATTTSEFSETESFESGAEWFDPVLELTLLPDNTVQGKLTDRSYLDETYEIWLENSEDGLLATATLSDSGQVFTFVDAIAKTGGDYTYHVDAILPPTCPDPILNNVTTNLVTVPTTPVTSTQLSAPLRATPQQVKLSMFPNPVKDVTRLQLIDYALVTTVHITLTDQYGRTIIRSREVKVKEHGYLENQIDFETLPSGVYLITVRVKDEVAATRVIIH